MSTIISQSLINFIQNFAHGYTYKINTLKKRFKKLLLIKRLNTYDKKSLKLIVSGSKLKYLLKILIKIIYLIKTFKQNILSQ